jgi:hypothetical protein
VTLEKAQLDDLDTIESINTTYRTLMVMELTQAHYESKQGYRHIGDIWVQERLQDREERQCEEKIPMSTVLRFVLLQSWGNAR